MGIRFLTTFMLLEFCFVARPQVIAAPVSHQLVEEGRSWKTEVIDTESGVQPSTHSHYIKGDTLIYNETWKKVFFSKEGQEDSYFAAMREEGQKVYAIASGCDTPRLLYDFSLQVGDTPICISE